MKPTVYIRVDGGSQIGLGHIVRCLALASMLKNHFQITFFCKDIPASIEKELYDNGIGLVRIQNEEQFFELLSEKLIVVMDGYGFDTSYQKQIKAIGCKLVCIDDLHDKEFVADLIINHAPGVKPKDYKAQPITKFALGPEFALQRPAFLEQAKKQRKIEKLETAMICFGGSDNKNYTEIVLKILIEFKELNKINVVTGASYKKTTQFYDLLLKDKRIVHHHALNEKEMLAVMLESDLAIVPSSGILIEAIAAGCQIISGFYVENQKHLYLQFLKLGAFISANDFNQISVRQAVFDALNKICSFEKIIDGKSNKRILASFFEMISLLRAASYEDCMLLFNWVNDSEVRNNAIHKDSIVLENHIKWFKSKLGSKNCKIFILELMNIPVGQIRFDKKEDYWLIDYSIQDEYRGLGLGKIVLQKSIPLFKSKILKAQVKKNNIASSRVFEILGFEKKTDKLLNSENFTEYELMV